MAGEKCQVCGGRVVNGRCYLPVRSSLQLQLHFLYFDFRLDSGSHLHTGLYSYSGPYSYSGLHSYSCPYLYFGSLCRRAVLLCPQFVHTVASYPALLRKHACNVHPGVH